MYGNYGDTSVYQVELASDMTARDVWIPPREVSPQFEPEIIRYPGPTEELACVLDRVVAQVHTVASVDASEGATTIPLNYHQAHRRADSAKWAEAEEAELLGLVNKQVFQWRDVGDIPPHVKVLTTRFVYDFKTNQDNEIIKYKARLVVRGFEQREGIEYGETFSATVRATSIRVVLALAARERLRLWQMDVEQAFLTAELGNDVVYVRPPPGQERPRQVWQLNKALYGLKQASHKFEKHFAEILCTELKLKRLDRDKSIYFMTRMRRGTVIRLIVCVYVDDLIIAYEDDMILEEFKRELTRRIRMKDVGQLQFCLGMHVKQDPRTYSITVNQTGFVQDLLNRTGFNTEGVRTRVTPVLQGSKISKADCPTTPSEESEMRQEPYSQYRSIVGSLMYLTGATRPDIGYAVHRLSRFVQNPGKPHWHSLVHLLRYLAGTSDLGVHYCGYIDQGIVLQDEQKKGLHSKVDALPNPALLSESFKNNLVSYADADWAADVDTRKSTTGWVVYLNGGPIAWRAKGQSIVATSTAESELYALADCMKQVRAMQMLLKELGFPQPQKAPGRGGATAEPNSTKNRGSVIYEDNQGCAQIVKNDVFAQRTKHIDTMYMFTMQYVELGYVSIQPVPTEDQVADLMTKGVTGGILARLRSKLMGSWFRSSEHVG
jgi:hypothetical protein